jgi:crossover junction endonuclease EME1
MFLERNFCMDAGQVKSGQNPEDTFNKMLQQVARVTPQIADSITGTYKSVHSLMAAFERGGPDILEDFPVPNFPPSAPLGGCFVLVVGS